MKKIMLTTGTILATSVPITTIISCSEKLPEKTVTPKKLGKLKSIILETLEIENNEIDIDKINKGLDEISKLFGSNYKVKLILDKKEQTNQYLVSKENILQEGDSLQIELEIKSGAINIMPLLNSIKEGKSAPILLKQSNILKNDIKKSTDKIVVSASDITFLLNIINNVKYKVKQTNFSKLMSASSGKIISSWDLENLLSQVPDNINELIGIKVLSDTKPKNALIKKGIQIFIDVFLLQYKFSKTDSRNFLELVSPLTKK